MRYLGVAIIAYVFGCAIGLHWIVGAFLCFVLFTLLFWKPVPQEEPITYPPAPALIRAPRIVEVKGLFDKRNKPRRAIVHAEYGGHVEAMLLPHAVGDRHKLCLPYEYILRWVS